MPKATKESKTPAKTKKPESPKTKKPESPKTKKPESPKTKKPESPKKSKNSESSIQTLKTLELSLLNQNDETVTDFSGKMVIFMYPKANTPGCTKQACGFRDSFDKIKEKGYKIYGLSADSPKSLLNWKTKYNLQYDFLSDPDYKLIKFFGAFKTPKGIKRSVVILEDGVVVMKEIQISPLDSVSRVSGRVMKFRSFAATILKARASTKSLDSTLHPDNYLKVALEWPREAQEPSNYAKDYPAEFFPLEIQHPNPDGSDSHEYAADLINPTTTRILSLILGGFLLNRVNDYYFGNYSQHPLSTWLGEVLDKFYSRIDEREAFYFELIKNEQNERLLFKEERHFKDSSAKKYYKKPLRLLSAGILEPSVAPNIGAVSSELEMANVKWKHSWEEKDEINSIIKELY